jgi:hypothetical protein
VLLAGCSSSGGGDDDSSDNDVTFSGTIDTGATAVARSIGRQAALSTDPTDYQLFCVTFTDPPRSGTADFDASGNFTITIEGAAGLPIGCFINEKASGTTVTSITFEVGDDSGLGDGTSSSAAVGGGEHTINIHFDPTTGTATTDVTTIVTDDVAAPTFEPANMVGTWIMSCSEDNTLVDLARCRGEDDDDDLESDDLEDDDDDNFDGLRVYLDVITGTKNGEKRYAMGAWDGEDAYTAAGRTEAIPESELEGFTDVSSLSENGSVTNAFNGFAGQAEYDRSNNTMTAADILTVLERLGMGYNKSFDNDGTGTGPCDDEVPDLSTMLGRRCLVAYLHDLADEEDTLVPDLDQSVWSDFVHNDQATGATPVRFRATELGASPALESRFALMGLEFVGNTAVATDREEFTYMRFEESQEAEECHETFEVTIVMSFIDEDTVKGRFTEAEFDSCEDEAPEVRSVLVNFTRAE